MKYKQAYIKLASLRLAINYVLRNRAMTKSASGWTNPLIGTGLGAGLGYLLSPEKHKLFGTLSGGLLGGVAGYGFDQWKTPKNKQDNISDSYAWLRNLGDASSKEVGLADGNKVLVYPYASLSEGTPGPLELKWDLEGGYRPSEDINKFMPEYAEIYNSQFKPETTPGWADSKQDTPASVSAGVVESPSPTSPVEASALEENRPAEDPEAIPIQYTAIPSVDPNLPPEMSTTWASTSEPTKSYSRRSQLEFGREVEEEPLQETVEQDSKEETKLPMDTRWLRELGRQSSVDLGGGYYSYLPKTYTPLRLRIGLPEDAPTPLELADKIDAGEATQEDINKWVPFYYEGYNRFFDPDLWDKPEEQTAIPATDSDLPPEVSTPKEEESNKTEESTSTSNKYQKFLDEWMAEGNEPPEDQADPDYKGIKPEYYWLVNLGKVLDEGEERNSSGYDRNLNRAYGPSSLLFYDRNGDDPYSKVVSPVRLAWSLSHKPGDTGKFSLEEEQRYLQDVVNLYDKYNQYDVQSYGSDFPAYPVSDLLTGEEVIRQAKNDKNKEEIVRGLGELYSANKNLQEQVSRIKEERDIERELEEINRKAKDTVDTIARLSEGSLVDLSKAVWVEELAELLKRRRELEEELEENKRLTGHWW